MNFLAHSLISLEIDEQENKKTLYGNFAGDFYKGLVDKIELPEELKEGIVLHRIIDGISDRNEKGSISEGKEQEEYIFCYKGRGRLSREEYNLPLTKEAYETLVRKTEGRVIRKRRYAIPYGSYTVELDIFQGELEGLCYAEVEFPSEEEALSFQPLDWFSEELTGEKGYSNAELSFAKELSNLKLKD